MTHFWKRKRLVKICWLGSGCLNCVKRTAVPRETNTCVNKRPRRGHPLWTFCDLLDVLGPLPMTHGLPWASSPRPPPGTSWAPSEAMVILKVMSWGQVQGTEWEVSGTVMILRKYQGDGSKPRRVIQDFDNCIFKWNWPIIFLASPPVWSEIQVILSSSKEL